MTTNIAAEPDFHLLRPGHLPGRAQVLESVHAGGRGGGAVLPPAVWDADGAVALAGVRAALADPPNRVGIVTGGLDPEESPGNRDNDRTFRIVRVDGDRPWLLLRSVLTGYEMLLDDAARCGTGLTTEQWTALRGGVAGLLAYLSGSDTAIPAGGFRAVAPRAGANPAMALRRWVRGHRLFMVIIQGMTLVVGELIEALRHEEGDAATALDLAGRLMHASESALRFASDFTADEYADVVRPTLMPPTAPEGLSGLHWRDHEHLVRRLTELTGPLARAGGDLAPLRARFREAYSAVYDAHSLVCARFVGDEAVSLLMTPKSKQSAVGVLARYHRVRLQDVPE